MMTRIVIVLCLFAALCGIAGAKGSEFLLGANERVVVLGDSITADGRYVQFVQNLVDARFPERRIRFISAGASGDTIRRSFGRIEADVVAWRPTWVLINLGVNDLGQFSTEDYLANYEALINRLQRDTDAKIGLMSFIYFDRDRKDVSKEEAFVAGIQALAAKYNCLYLPCYETFRRIRPTLPKGIVYASDGTHPNPLGYWIFAEAILEALHYPFDKQPLAIELPYTRCTKSEEAASAALAGQTFTLALVQPLKVTVTPFTPNTTTVPRAGKPITVDGKLNDWVFTAPIKVYGTSQQSGGVVSWNRDSGMHGATAYACYDDKAWYFAINVRTASVVNRPASTGVVRDCIELFLDLRTPQERAGAKSSVYLVEKFPRVCQYIFMPATAESPKPEPFVGSGDKSMLEGVTWASSLTTTGYILEIAVPAARFPGGAITPGAEYGLDFSINDIDRFETWSDLTQLRWSGSQISFFSAQEFGRMTLGQ